MPTDRYKIQELLGEGGMGVVYRALDTRTGSYVALKTLRDSSDPLILEMFKREWAELAKLSHPNIVDIRDVDEVTESGVRKPCFIMPLLPGVTLATLINSASPRITVEFVVSVICQVCKGLQAAHERDLIHRDLKPSNIFIMNDDTAKIIDFGLVHAIGNKSVTGLKGTWQYMSPEQIEGKPPNRSFDIFSLGIVAYEALTGHQPFKRGQFEDTVEAIRHFIPQAISEMNPKVPQLLSRAVHVAMAKQPIHRYTSAREFAETLQKAANNQYLERFDPAKLRPRIERAKRAFAGGDSDFASEILTELEAEGNLDPEITLLRAQIDESNKQKRIRQLFEAAQSRLEQDEIPLALDKLGEVLKIDPQHPEALALRKRIDQQRSQQQVADWLNLARQHLERADFREARLALKEVFNLKYDDPEAGRLKAEIDDREKEVATARNEKEHLYSSALKAHQNGEISSALSKLAKILDLSRGVPGSSVPERDKVFQAFYNDVRIERDRIDNAYAEATRHLAEKNFTPALQVCDGILARYPRNPQFQALRLKVEHSQRQELSAFIAEVGRAVDSEPNLDRRVGLLEEACTRYPNEEQFRQQFSLARELRDLVASIVARARAYEEQGQFAEAITQWKTLANTHPQYPGIDFEISQLDRRREQQAEDEKKSRLVQKIDRALENSAYADAERLCHNALLQFPQDQELLVLLRMASEGVERTQEANRLFEEAKALRATGEWERAVAHLRQALDLDQRNIVVLNTLVNLLVERAHALLDSDWRAAEPLAAEAGRLDPEHPSVNKVISLIAQAKKKDYVERCVLQARALQTSDVRQAVDILKHALAIYPGELRLQQTLTSLQKEDTRSGGGAVRYAVAEQKTAVFPIEEYTQQAAAAPPANRKPPQAPPPTPPQRATPPFWKNTLAEISAQGASARAWLLSGKSRNYWGAVLGLLAAVLLIALGYRYINRPRPAAPKLVSAEVRITVHATPSDAAMTLDGNAFEGTHAVKKGATLRLSVSRLGYVTENRTVAADADTSLSIDLKPEPLHISVSTSEPSGTVFLDGATQGNLADGEWSSDLPLREKEEEHELSASGKGGELFKIRFKAAAAQTPAVDPVKSKNIVVAGSLGKDAVLYGSTTLLLEGKERQHIVPSGLAVNLEQVPDGKITQPLLVEPGNAPTLSVSLNGTSNVTTVAISSTPNTAKLFINGLLIRTKTPGHWELTKTPGKYKAKLTAEGMDDDTFPIIVQKGQAQLGLTREMKKSGPVLSTLVVEDCTPGATVYIDDSAIDQPVDDQGNLTYPGVSPGTHSITLTKPGYGPQTVSGKIFSANGKVPVSHIKLSPQVGHVKFSIKPGNATVRYKRRGEESQMADTSKILDLAPGTYQFTAEAEKLEPQTQELDIKPAVTTPFSVTLQPRAPVTEETKAFVDPGLVVRNGDWYAGKNKDFVPLLTHHAKNTLVFLKGKAKKMTWRIFLDDANNITYTLDNKGLSSVATVDGVKVSNPRTPLDMSGAGRADNSYVVRIHLLSDGVKIAKHDETVVDKTPDDKHDWRRATIYVRGDTTFTVWLNQ
jgi:serine/threonine-protein kinase